MRRRKEEYERINVSLKERGFINAFYADHAGREVLNRGKRFYPQEIFLCEGHVFDEEGDSGEIFYTYAIKTKSGLKGILEVNTKNPNFERISNLVLRFQRL